MIIVFLILNYETYWETFACVNSIYNVIGENLIEKEGHKIIIVENGSRNDSLFKLKEKYFGKDGIIIIENKENLGFSKGNNQGFLYAKRELNPDFIVMINSDIIITDFLFEKKIKYLYKKLHFAVAGPDVILPNGNHLNPVYSRKIQLEDIRKSMKKFKRKIIFCKLHIEPFFAGVDKILNLNKRRNQRKFQRIREEIKLDLQQMQLHGCFLIFSREYIEKFDGIYDKTFLYGEETLLRLRCIRTNITMFYLPSISALHNESRTEKYVGGTINQRHLRRYQNLLNSLYVIEEYLLSKDI